MPALPGDPHRALPRSDDIVPPPSALLRRGRPFAAALLRRQWDIQVRGTAYVPEEGPVVLAGNHVGFLDGPLMAIIGPRPVHALTKEETFSGALGPLLRASGQIRLWRQGVDPLALRTGVRVLRDGGVVGMFPESTRGSGEVHRIHGGAAYLAMVTGATIVPMAFLGTRVPGGSANSVPPRRTRMVVTFGQGLSVAEHPWPRRRAAVEELSAQLRDAMRETVREAQQATGLQLPGPIPGRSEEDSDD